MNWKNASIDAFKQQLKRNLYELNGDYPLHWHHFIWQIESIRGRINRVVDVGCGVGVYYEVCRRIFPGLDYIGYDCAENAIKLAKSQWRSPNFQVKDYKDINFLDIKNGDVIVANALCDVLEDGDSCLRFLMGLTPDFLILQRVKITDKPNHMIKYKAYEEVDTVEFYHNEEELYKDISRYKYKIENISYYFENILDLLLRFKIVPPY